MPMKNNYYDAFIPSIAFGKTSGKQISHTNSLVNIYKVKKVKISNEPSSFLIRTLMSNGINNELKGKFSATLLEELAKEQEKSKNPLDVLSPLNKKIISILIIVSSMLSGWVLTPSRSKWVSLGVSFLAGGLSFLALKKFDTKNTLKIQEQLIQLFALDLEGEKVENKLSIIKKDFNMSSQEIRMEIMKIYKKLLGFFLRNSSIALEEIEELINFRSFFSMSAQDLGECHFEFAQDLYKDYIVMTERQGSEGSITIVNKFFFLSDRLFCLDTKKGYQYESSRIRKIFLFSQETVEKTCKEISLDLYIQSIFSFSERRDFQTEKLTDVEKNLGIEKEEKKKVHMDFYKKKIQEILNNESGFSLEGKEELMNLQNLLNILPETSAQTLSDITGPLFCSEVMSSLETINSTQTEESLRVLAENLATKKEALLLQSETFSDFFFQGVKKTAENLTFQILNDLKFQQKENILSEVEKLLNLSNNSEKLFLILDSGKSKEVSEFLSEALGNLGKKFSPKELYQLYKVYIEITLEEDPFLRVTPEKENKWKKLSDLLSLSPKEVDENYKLVAGPIFQEKIKEVLTGEKFEKDNKKEIQDLEESLKLGKHSCSIIKTSGYRECLEKILEDKKILNPQDLSKLNNIRIFLSLKWENVQTIHDITSEPIFKKSVLEAMGATGIIPSTYWEGLEKLRKRLLLTEFKAKEIFYQCVKEKMTTIFEKAVMENKKKNSPQNADTKDGGEDPTVKQGAGTALGIEAGDSSGNQLFNLIDFYFRNQIFIENEKVFSENKRSSLKGLSGRSEIQLGTTSKPDFSYPVTLKGQFEEKTLNEMYRQYLVDCFSAKLQSEKRRLFNNLDKLGPILGLSSSQINSIHSTVGALIYQKYLSQALSKGYLDQSDNAFLSNIQLTLSMDSGKCSEIVKEGKRSIVKNKVEQIFSSPNVNSGRVSEMRKLAIQFGIDLKNDLNVSQEQRSKMFRVEIDSEIEKGKITNKSQRLLLEIQNSFSLDDNTSKKILLECITTRCEGHLVNGIASLRRNAEKEVLKELEKMLSFGNLLPIKIQSSIGSKNEKLQLLTLFQSFAPELNSNGKFQEKLDLLKLMLDI